MTRPPTGISLASLLLLAGILCMARASAQETHYWVGGSGAWSDAAHWSLAPDGAGGAGVPSGKDAVVVGPVTSDVSIQLEGNNAAASLQVDGSEAQVGFHGSNGRLLLKGDLVLGGNVDWDLSGGTELVADKHSVVQVSTRGIPLGGDLVLRGGGAFNLANDLVLREGSALELREGTLVLNGSMLKADALGFPGSKTKKLMAGSSVVILSTPPSTNEVRDAVDSGSSKLLVAGELMDWGTEHGTDPEGARGTSLCGVGAGQTLFTIDAQLLSNYNGFGISCHNACDGQVTVTATGGVGPFTYVWIGGPATATWTNVCAGNQIVIVTDQGQHVSCATTVQVTDPARLSVILTGNIPPSCSGVCDGSSTALAVGGVANYSYSWNNGAGTLQTFSGLCPGLNSLQVLDANSCAFDTIFNFPLIPIVPNLTKTDVQCFGTCNGTAQVAPTGGGGGYTYDWQPGNPTGDGTSAVSGLCPGTYTITISDLNGCDTTIAFMILEPQAIFPNATHVDASCANSCDGSATVAPTGGSGNYGFSWSPAPGSGGTSATATGLCAGVYTVTITDNVSGCDTLVPITIAAPPPIVPSPSSTDITCANDCDGTATAPATGGAGPLTYVWTPSVTGQGTPSASQLCPGTYSVTISDASGCDTTVQFIISAPPPIIPLPTQTEVSCFGACDGSISAPATGGTGTLTYDWQPGNPTGDGTETVSQLCAGPWSVTISDGNGCDTTLQFTITEPLPMALTASQTDITCGADCDGTATVVVTGGTPNYTYAWAPAPPLGQGTASASELCPGQWTVTITDDHGCQLVQVFDILPAVPIDAAVATAPVSCAGICDGTATGVVSGGVAPYTYVWDPAPAGGQGTLNATGLCAGPGTFTVTDLVGCDTTIAFIIGAPPPIQVASTVTDVSCFGACDGSIILNASGGTDPFIYAWTPASAGAGATALDLCAGDYQVVVTSGVCDTTINFTIDQPPPFDLAFALSPSACANTCTGTATLTGDLSGLTFAWAPAPGAGQGTANATGLCAGDYTVTVANAAGCDTVIAFTITAPPPLVPVLQITNASCGAACDGMAVLPVTGGTGSYTYFWAPAPGTGQGTSTAGGLCPGDYTVTVTDAAGCDTTLQFTIARPSGIAATAIISPATCANTCDGTIEVTATGGVAPYTWAWSPEPGNGQGTASVSGLCPGDHTVTIGDQAGCDTTITFTVGSPDAIDPHGVFTNESCAGPCDGTATVAPTGGDGTFSYAWTPASAGTGPTATGLCAGDYSVTVTDDTGCDTTWSFTVMPTSSIQASVVTIDGFCANACNGEGIVTATGGAGGFVYQWTPEPAAGQGLAHATGFCAGPGSVVVTDAGGCDTTLFFTITKNPPIQPNLDVFAETCAGPCSGEAAVYPVGGVGPYTYLWMPPPQIGGQTDFTAFGLCAGTPYTVTITDSLGCDTTIAFTVATYVPVVPTVSVVPATCANSCDGSASASASGGSGTYTYFWTPVPPNGQGVSVATGLCAGTYALTVTDDNGCDSTVSFTITAPAAIEPGATITPISCAAQCNGAIDLNVLGGSGNFTYTWTPAPPTGDGTAHVSDLCAGDWTVVIADDAGCDTSITFTLVEPLPLTATMDVLPSHCLVCDGFVQLHPAGGSAPYGFTFGPPLNLSTTDSSLTDLCAGVYSVTMTDAMGCTVQLAMAVPDADGEVLAMEDGMTSCPGVCDGQVSVAYNCSVDPCTAAWFDMQGNSLGQTGDTLSNLCAGSYLVAVTNGNGCISIDTASVSEPAPLVGNISSTPVGCIGDCDGTATIGITGGTGPFVFTWTPAPGGTGQGAPHATGLCAGTYNIHVDDLGGCDADFSVLITTPAPITAAPDLTEISCAGLCDGAIELNATGGSGTLTYVWTPAPPIGQGTGSVGGLCPGTWSVLLFDGHGCDTTITFTLVDPAPLTIMGSATLSHCAVCDGTAQVAVTGGTAPVDIEWLFGGNPVGTDTALTGLCAGLYTVTATDAHGCIATQSLPVPDANAEDLSVQNGQTLCANSCEGEVSVVYNCSAPTCTTTWLDASGGQLAQGQDTLGGLCPGLYFVLVGNGDGCLAIDTAMVVPSQVITPNLSTTPVACIGSCDGTATVGPTGGIAPYGYVWDNGETTAQVTGLCAGTYEVTITDASGCDTTVQVLINAPQPITVAVQVQDASCNDSCDGSIVLNPSGGSGQFSYVWAPDPPSGLGNNGAFNLCPGTWTVTVADVNGCDTTLSIVVGGPTPLVLTATSTLSECNVCNGTADLQVSGGTAPYATAWLQGTAIVGTDTSISSLCAGLYNAVVQDANGCVAHLPVPISDTGGETVQAFSTLLTCPGDCDGQLHVDHSCSIPACTIAWFSGNGLDLGQSGDTISNLCSGTYFVQVTNGAGCITFDTAHVIPPPQINANLSTTPETCAGSCNGTALVAPTGGHGPDYQYHWQPDVAGQDSPQAVFLCAGNYTVTITDMEGCTMDQGVLILSPQPITATVTSVQNVCNDACDGTITVLGQGGTGVISYLWDPVPPGGGQGTGTATGLCAGTWSVTLGDANGCDTTLSFTLVDPPALTVDVTHTDNACFNDCVATAHAQIAGGLAPYSTVWTGPDGTVIDIGDIDVIGLCAGEYILTVSDSSGCQDEVHFNIGAGTPILAGLVVQGESCNGPCDGTATVSPSGGSGSGFGFLWQPDVNGQGTATATDLCPGDYTVTITDGLGCDTTYAFTVEPFSPLQPNAIVQDVSCNGACDGTITLNVLGGVGGNTYTWSPQPPDGQGTAEVSNLCPQTWEVTITDAAGCDTTATFTISEPLPLAVTVDETVPANCTNSSDGAISISVSGGTADYSFEWNGPEGYGSINEDLVGLNSGTYDLTVTDQHGCTFTTQVEVPALNSVMAVAGADTSGCTGALFVLNGSASQGATTFAWSEVGGGLVGSTPSVTVEGLTPGQHIYVLTVADDICSDVDTILVDVFETPAVDAGPDHEVFQQGTVALGGSPSGPAGSQFTWQPDSLLDQSNIPNPVATVLETVWFQLTVTSPEGCVAVDSTLVTVVPEIKVPSGFTPNGDGHNDTWILDFAPLFPNIDVQVFSRWGEPLFHSVGYSVPWDGKTNGTVVPVGTYYYAIELNDPRFPDPMTGPLTVIR